MTDALLHVEDVAGILGVSKSTVHELLLQGTIPHRRLPGMRRVLIPRTDLDAWIEGAALERIDLGGKARIVRPISKRTESDARCPICIDGSSDCDCR